MSLAERHGQSEASRNRVEPDVAYARRLRTIVRRVDGRPGPVLDCGAGLGHPAQVLTDHGHQVIGVEPDLRRLVKAIEGRSKVGEPQREIPSLIAARFLAEFGPARGSRPSTVTLPAIIH